jgi:hypothetical protein
MYGGFEGREVAFASFRKGSEREVNHMDQPDRTIPQPKAADMIDLGQVDQNVALVEAMDLYNVYVELGMYAQIPRWDESIPWPHDPTLPLSLVVRRDA